MGIPILRFDILNKQDVLWLTPLVFGITCLGIFWDKIRDKIPYLKKSTKKIEQTASKDKSENRQKELRLISRRVREIFMEETRKKGLIILEAYYGSKQHIDQLITKSVMEKSVLLSSPEFANKVLDATDSIRFYVETSKLVLTKGTKVGLYGLYDMELPDDTCYLYIK